MNKRYHIVVLLMSCMVLSGCGPDFGDQILEWVRKNARTYSANLTRADLHIRWFDQFNENYRTIAYHQEKADAALHEAYKSTELLSSVNLVSLKDLLRVYDESKRNIDQLILIQHRMEDIKTLFVRLDSIGTLKQFESAGLRAVGKESLMRSFMEIGDVHEKINKLRYQKIFNLRYSISINTETGAVDHQANQDVEGPSYSGSFEGFLASFPITAPIYALFIQDEIEEQKKQIKRALDLFDVLSLKPYEQFLISNQYVDSARTAFKPMHQQLDTVYKAQHKAWKMMYAVNVALRNEAAAKIAPFKLAAAERELNGQRAIDNLLNEEKQYAVKQDVIGMIAELKRLKRVAVLSADPYSKAEASEAFSDAAVEAELMIKAMLGRLELTAVYPFLEKRLKEVVIARQEANVLLTRLNIRQ